MLKQKILRTNYFFFYRGLYRISSPSATLFDVWRSIVLENASMEAVMFCKDVSDRTEGDFEPSHHIDKKIKACCLHLKNACNYKVQDNSETSFMQKYLLPYLNEIYMVNSQKNSVCAMVDGVEESGNFPDWKLGYKKSKNKSLFIFFVEVKRPGQTSKYQAEDDYVKLTKEMKDSLDEQIELGFDSPFSFGLLVEELKKKGYMPRMIKKFSLMQEVEDAVNIPAMVETLVFVKEKMASIDKMFRDRSRAKPLVKFMKPSFHTEFK
ncbi:hypothetical protein [Parasitella parasitica]|uniref:Uncharacterized protein n=1 Tax=Parasitella parasitica TaxID=35722 RepID=A0A0B7N1X2_9FUNG|nr:hypothetical protein [Parasitella parasitica]